MWQSTAAQRQDAREEKGKMESNSDQRSSPRQRRRAEEETGQSRNATGAEREERSTVMRSQMLLISCAAVRVPAMATVSHGTSKQRRPDAPPPRRGSFTL